MFVLKRYKIRSYEMGLLFLDGEFRGLEVLEKIAAAGKLNIVLGEKSLGEKGLADKVINLL